MSFVERGSITLIGATTENPSFEVNSALLSRAKVFVLHSLSTDDIIHLLKNAINDPAGFPGLDVQISDKNLRMITEFSNGDARSSLNTLENAVLNGKKTGKRVVVDESILQQLINTKSLRYDKKGNEVFRVKNSKTPSGKYLYLMFRNGKLYTYYSKPYSELYKDTIKKAQLGVKLITKE